ncbi:MAG: hypothetical protein CSB02_00780 [Bacteroidia bacterium]|nr:MAG: hypothetical protein CSB02_00780 [Bacteroidia bacterium]
MHTAALQIPLATWVLLSIFIISDILLYNKRIDIALDKLPYVLRWAVYGILLFCVITMAGVENFPFIYFQF